MTLMKCLYLYLKIMFEIIAEKCLESLEGCEGYSTLLLQLLDNSTADMVIRIAAVVNFKNMVKRNWRIVSTLH